MKRSLIGLGVALAALASGPAIADTGEAPGEHIL